MFAFVSTSLFQECIIFIYLFAYMYFFQKSSPFLCFTSWKIGCLVFWFLYFITLIHYVGFLQMFGMMFVFPVCSSHNFWGVRWAWEKLPTHYVLDIGEVHSPYRSPPHRAEGQCLSFPKPSLPTQSLSLKTMPSAGYKWI